MLKKLSVLGLTFAVSATLTAQTVINGAGASFPAPVYQSWTYVQPDWPNKVNYQSVGSGTGVSLLRPKPSISPALTTLTKEIRKETAAVPHAAWRRRCHQPSASRRTN